MRNRLHRSQQRHQSLAHRLQRVSPVHQVASAQQQSQSLTQRLTKAMDSQLQYQQQRFARVTGILNSVSPLATLSRGYSISFVGDKVVMDPQDVQSGDILKTKLANGEITSKVV